MNVKTFPVLLNVIDQGRMLFQLCEDVLPNNLDQINAIYANIFGAIAQMPYENVFRLVETKIGKPTIITRQEERILQFHVVGFPKYPCLSQIAPDLEVVPLVVLRVYWDCGSVDILGSGRFAINVGNETTADMVCYSYILVSPLDIVSSPDQRMEHVLSTFRWLEANEQGEVTTRFSEGGSSNEFANRHVLDIVSEDALESVITTLNKASRGMLNREEIMSTMEMFLRYKAIGVELIEVLDEQVIVPKGTILQITRTELTTNAWTLIGAKMPYVDIELGSKPEIRTRLYYKETAITLAEFKDFYFERALQSLGMQGSEGLFVVRELPTMRIMEPNDEIPRQILVQRSSSLDNFAQTIVVPPYRYASHLDENLLLLDFVKYRRQIMTAELPVGHSLQYVSNTAPQLPQIERILARAKLKDEECVSPADEITGSDPGKQSYIYLVEWVSGGHAWISEALAAPFEDKLLSFEQLLNDNDGEQFI